MPKVGDRRVRSRFLLFSKTIDGEKRYWERAMWIEEYQRSGIYDNGCHFPFNEWVAIKWCDVDEEVKG